MKICTFTCKVSALHIDKWQQMELPITFHFLWSLGHFYSSDFFKMYVRGYPSSMIIFAVARRRCGQDMEVILSHLTPFWAEGIPSSWENAMRKLSGVSCCHGVSVGVLSYTFCFNIVAVTVGFVIMLLFPAYCSYLSRWFWHFVHPAGAEESGRCSWF